MVKKTPFRWFYLQTFFLVIFLVLFYGPTIKNTENIELGFTERLMHKTFPKDSIAFFFAGRLAPHVLVKTDTPSGIGGFKIGDPTAPFLILTLPSFSIPFYSFDLHDFLILNTLYPHHFFF